MIVIDKKILTKYTSYFHDGSIIDIEYEKDPSELIISMESAELDLEDIKDPIPLSEEKNIRGKLHLLGVKKIFINKELLKEPLKMKYDCGLLLDFDIENTRVFLGIAWINYRPKPPINDFSGIDIEIEDLYWENIPDLYDPFA